MRTALAEFAASGTPTLVGSAQAGGPSSATVTLNTTGATLLVAWTATEGADPTALTDSHNNSWQALPVSSNGIHSHGRFFYAFSPTVGPGHTFTLTGEYPAIAVSAWSGTVTAAAVYVGDKGAANNYTESLSTAAPTPTGNPLYVAGWASDNNFSQGLNINQGFTIGGSVTSGANSELLSFAYLIGPGSPLATKQNATVREKGVRYLFDLNDVRQDEV